MLVTWSRPVVLVMVVLCCFGWNQAFGQSQVSAKSYMYVGSSVDGISAVQQHSRNVNIQTHQLFDVLEQEQAVSITDFPVSLTATGTLELERTTPVVDQRTVIETKDGLRSAPLVHSFRGYVGNTNSRVFVSMFEDAMICAIEHEDGSRFTIAPSQHIAKANHVIMREDELQRELFQEPALCGVNDDVHHEEEEIHSEKRHDQTLAFDLRELQLAVETDSYLYDNFNGDQDALEQYVIALVAMVSDIYERDVQVKVHLSYLYMYSNDTDGNADPYDGARGQVNDLLYEFGEYWSANRTTVNRDLAHLLSAYPSGGGVIGVAWTGSNYRGTLCRKNRFSGYGASGIRGNESLPTSAFTSAVATMAHELGHNFGSPHTHNCWWQENDQDLIDTCMTQLTPIASDGCLPINPVPTLGTIMSYCFNVNSTGTVAMEFHPVVIEQIRGNVENSSCLVTYDGPTLFINTPSGNESVRSEAELSIGWTSTDVAQVRLEWRFEEDESEWSEIATVNAADGVYSWTLPDILEADVLIRVIDASNANLFDEVLAPVMIRGPILEVVRPEAEERIATNSEYTIRWDRRFVPAVNIDFSADGGQTWERIASNVEASFWDWEVPTVVTEQAIIRVTEVATGELVDESEVFVLGQPSIAILYPVGGEEFISGTQEVITWESQFVGRVRIDYSLDGGTTWRLISFSFPSDRGEYTWNVPTIDADREENVFVRFTSLDDLSETRFATVEPFAIAKSPTSVSDIERKNEVITTIDGRDLLVTVSGTKDSYYDASIVTVTGETVVVQATIESSELATGYKLSVGELPAGAYFVRLEGTSEALIGRFIITR